MVLGLAARGRPQHEMSSAPDPLTDRMSGMMIIAAPPSMTAAAGHSSQGMRWPSTRPWKSAMTIMVNILISWTARVGGQGANWEPAGC